MNKEEVLTKSREENRNIDIAEQDVIQQSSSIATKVGLLLCCVINIVQVIISSEVNSSCWVVYFGMMGTLFLVKFLKLRRKHELALTILYYAVGIFFFAVYILKIVGKM